VCVCVCHFLKDYSFSIFISFSHPIHKTEKPSIIILHITVPISTTCYLQERHFKTEKKTLWSGLKCIMDPLALIILPQLALVWHVSREWPLNMGIKTVWHVTKRTKCTTLPSIPTSILSVKFDVDPVNSQWNSNFFWKSNNQIMVIHSMQSNLIPTLINISSSREHRVEGNNRKGLSSKEQWPSSQSGTVSAPVEVR